jgi:hypothetical protein
MTTAASPPLKLVWLDAMRCLAAVECRSPVTGFRRRCPAERRGHRLHQVGSRTRASAESELKVRESAWLLWVAARRGIRTAALLVESQIFCFVSADWQMSVAAAADAARELDIPVFTADSVRQSSTPLDLSGRLTWQNWSRRVEHFWYRTHLAASSSPRPPPTPSLFPRPSLSTLDREPWASTSWRISERCHTIVPGASTPEVVDRWSNLCGTLPPASHAATRGAARPAGLHPPEHRRNPPLLVSVGRLAHR